MKTLLLALLLSGCSLFSSPAGQELTKTAIDIARNLIVDEFSKRGIDPDTAKALCFDAADVTGDDSATGLVCYIPEASDE